MAARAHRVSDRAEAEKVIRMLPLKYPNVPPGTAQMKMPAPEEGALFRVVPEIIPVLDYAKGFAHTDLATCSGGAARTVRSCGSSPVSAGAARQVLGLVGAR